MAWDGKIRGESNIFGFEKEKNHLPNMFFPSVFKVKKGNAIHMVWTHLCLIMKAFRTFSNLLRF
jgi:hypothetical protein